MQGFRLTSFIMGRSVRIEDVPKDVTHVRIDLSVLCIKYWAFYRQTQLWIVILNEELEEIGKKAFWGCRSL